MTANRSFGCNVGRMLVLLVLLLVAVSTSADTQIQSFDETLKRHLKAIVSRDLPGILATVADGDVLMLILPGGTRIDGKAAFAELHKEWFSDPNWRMELTEIRRLETAELCSVILHYTYRDTPDGPPRERYLQLVFQLIGAEWRLVFDQNTPIDPQ